MAVEIQHDGFLIFFFIFLSISKKWSHIEIRTKMRYLEQNGSSRKKLEIVINTN
jgi:hypothetical protein